MDDLKLFAKMIMGLERYISNRKEIQWKYQHGILLRQNVLRQILEEATDTTGIKFEN